MCGIYGITAKDEAFIQNYITTCSHRGPDGQGEEEERQEGQEEEAGLLLIIIFELLFVFLIIELLRG